ncbi:hypothetical protein [Streptomyces sp. AN091965]|uniref:hypothetical protein n=1 Tax=Streptomyces sp. AN091965 TaxID=2927803 RepID=UPI001F60C65B|nr:hypothetical protein [Streptomyces sp. AN091965]MCI3931630.1 hypothetical protein [Streptomyces sp. AN091965]
MLSRVRTPWCPLVAVLLVVLGAFCGPAFADRPAPPVERAAHVFVQETDGRGVPGCGRSDASDLGQRPAVPPRQGPGCELPPSAYAARVVDYDSWGSEPAVRAVASLRGPPPLTPPSPVDLSVLRV